MLVKRLQLTGGLESQRTLTCIMLQTQPNINFVLNTRKQWWSHMTLTVHSFSVLSPMDLFFCKASTITKPPKPKHPNTF